MFYNTQKEEDKGKGTIKDIIKNISDEYLEKLEIIKGELLINTKDNNEIKVAKELGIEVNPYDIDENGVLQSSGNNLALMDENGTLVIPDSVVEIGEGAFANEGLKTIIIPGTVKKIGKNAFAYNTTLETVIIQEGVEEIGETAFAWCENLKNIELPNSLKNIERAAFAYNSSLSEVKIPPQIEVINDTMFYECINLNKIILSEGLKEIEYDVFFHTNLSEITIPSTVDTIGNNAFYNNTKLNNIVINKKEGEEAKFVYESGMLMPSDKSKILFLSDTYLKSITTFEIPEGIIEFATSISNYNNITKLVIPSSLTSMIDASYFPTSISEIEVKDGNSKYVVDSNYKILYTKDTKSVIICYSKDETINLKDENNELGILKLANHSFAQATNVQNIILPDSLIEIDSYVFTNNQKVKEINIGKNVEKISPLFKNGNYNGKISIDEYNNNFVVENNILYSKDKKTLIVVLYKIDGTFTVDNSVEIIGETAFLIQNQMTNIIMTDNVKKIENAFEHCNKLINIEIPKSVESISSQCFRYCNNLEKVTIYNEKLLETAPWGSTKGDKVIDLKQ